MFRRLLIANRGEIAVRIARTAREMGIEVVAVHSDPDRHAPHVAVADRAVALPGVTSAETYLQGDRIIAIATAQGVDAIHPGYGFLSENAGFARACADAGITFVGPPVAAIEAMGDKIVAKRTMEAAGVPILPGWSSDGAASPDEVMAAAQDIGVPLLVKAAAGGGGKGMRLVEDLDDLPDAVAAAQREAGAAFGDARVFLERYLTQSRHIEVQIFGDHHGNAVHLLERECSIQRRHQKIVEEAPSPAVTPELREQMGAAGVAAAKALGYANAGTVEFMLDANGDFWFLEVNTRLQVEHPVTEAILGLDLVRLQLDVAAGAPLPFTEAPAPRGHAIECRIYAEDASAGFLPSTGTLLAYERPEGPGIRVDDGVVEGGEVTVHYDPMLGKLIAWAADRDAAIARMRSALRRFVVLGVTTNVAFLERLMAHPAFVEGDLHTRFLDEHAIDVPAPDSDCVELSALLAAVGANGTTTRSAAADRHTPGPWEAAGAWRAL